MSDARSIARLPAALAILALLVLAGPGRAHAQQADMTPVTDALYSVRDTLRQGFSDLKAKFDALLYPRWEYKVFIPNKLDSPEGRDRAEVDFAGLGREGWELVGFGMNQGYVFKRRAK